MTLDEAVKLNEVLRDLNQRAASGKRQAVATVIAIEKSAPMGPGATLVVSEDGVVTGSVSGGCVEPAVFEEAQRAIESGQSKRLKYGISDNQAFEVGLTCGGTIHLFVSPVPAEHGELFDGLKGAIDGQRPIALATVVEGRIAGARMLVHEDKSLGSLGDPGLDHSVLEDARGMLALGETGLLTYGTHGERRPEDIVVFIHSFAPSPNMYVFGAIDFASAVCRIGKFLGFRVTVCDARETFATEERFPEADRVVVEWPHEFLAKAHVDGRTVICILTHDPKFDVPLIKAALRTPAVYIGAMGSRKTHEERTTQLLRENVDSGSLRRISGPIGLDIGAVTPDEVAVSIAAEIIACRHGASGGRLADRSGPIHGSGHSEFIT